MKHSVMNNRLGRWAVLGALACALLSSGPARAGVVAQAQERARQAALHTPLMVDVDEPFNEQEARAMMAPGNARVVGAVYSALTRDGQDDVMLAPRISAPVSEAQVVLVPMTRHMRRYAQMYTEYAERMTSFSGSGGQQQTIRFHGDAARYMHVTVADRFGNFRFDHLKPGPYWLVVLPVVASGTYNQNVVVGHTGNYEHTQTQQFGWQTRLYLEKMVEVSEGENEVEARMRAMPAWYHQNEE